MRRFTSALFLIGLGLLIVAIYQQLGLQASSNIGQAINTVAADQLGAANFVTAVVLGYRGLDTLVELTILFTAATAGALVLGTRKPSTRRDPDAGFILQTGADLLFPLLLIVGLYIILHGHLTPGGGFQGGVILASAFFLPILARPGSSIDHQWVSFIEGIAGASFIYIGLLVMFDGKAFLSPVAGNGVLGELFSAGTLPILYVAVGLKVGAELAGLLASLSDTEAVD